MSALASPLTSATGVGKGEEDSARQEAGAVRLSMEFEGEVYNNIVDDGLGSGPSPSPTPGSPSLSKLKGHQSRPFSVPKEGISGEEPLTTAPAESNALPPSVRTSLTLEAMEPPAAKDMPVSASRPVSSGRRNDGSCLLCGQIALSEKEKERAMRAVKEEAGEGPSLITVDELMWLFVFVLLICSFFTWFTLQQIDRCEKKIDMIQKVLGQLIAPIPPAPELIPFPQT